MKTIGKASSLQWALEQLSEPPRHPDEFTAVELQAKTPEKTIWSVRYMLARMASEGKLQSRLATINGTKTNLYRRKDAKP